MGINSRIKKIIFDDFPHPLSVEEYDKCERSFLSYFQFHSAISAIYKIGDVNNPGISDLDLVLVFRENGKFSKEDCGFLRSLDKNIFVHDPFVIPEHLFQYIQYLFYTDNLQRVAGENFDILKPTSEIGYEQLLWQLCTESAIARLSDLIYQMALGSYLSARKMLLKISSIKHNINLYMRLIEAGGGKPELYDQGAKFKKEVTELRASWFLCQRKEQTRRMALALSSGVEILSVIISQMALYLKKFLTFLPKNRRGAFYLLPDLFQILKFESNPKTNFKIVFNPLTLAVKMVKESSPQIARHLNDLSVLTLPYELVCLFPPSNKSALCRSSLADDHFIIRGNRNNLWEQNETVTGIFQHRLYLINEYNDFMRKTFSPSLSYLLMAPWLIENTGKFHFLKKSTLWAALRLSLV